MTQKFKFGDRVQDGGTYVYLLDKIHPCATEPHPDTVRLDWLADPANKIGSVMLPTECVEQHLDSLRDAIDAAMRIQAAKAV